MRGDRGSISIVVTGVVAVGLVLVMALVAASQLLAGRVRAVNAADAAALAAAPVTFRPFGSDGDPRAEAARFAEANGATLVSCDCPLRSSYSPRTVAVVVRVRVDVLGFRSVHIYATGAAEFRPILLLESR